MEKYVQYIENGKEKRKIFSSVPVWLLAIGDVFFVSLGFVVAFLIRFHGTLPERNFVPFLETLPWVIVFTIIFFWGLGLYEKRVNGFTPLLRSVLIGVLGVVTATMAITFWLRGFSFPRSVIAIAGVCQLVLLELWRWLLWHIQRALYGRRDLLVIGPLAGIEDALDRLLELPGGWFKVKKALSADETGALEKEIARVDAVLVTPSVLHTKKNIIVAACQKVHVDVFLVPDLYEILVSGAQTTQLDDLPVMEIPDIRLSVFQLAIKRVFDFGVAVAGLVLAAPVLLGCALAVKLTSPGPVFYVQRRVGKDGRGFNLYKFRTMVDDAEKHTGPVLSTENDPRITPAGRFLRAARLDELPQLINVLKGEMSLVGPRPERPFFVEQFKRENPYYHYRSLVKPGITGLAQVNGKYTTSAEDKLRYDLYYIRNYSFMLDLKILLQTIPVVFSREASGGLRERDNAVSKRKKKSAIYALINDAGYTAKKER